MSQTAHSKWRRPSLLKTTLKLLLIAGVVSNVAAQTPASWGDLEPGPYRVGFRFLYKYDYSRGWKANEDANGYAQGLERVRPIRVSVWYPARSKSNAARMLYRDYMPLTARDSIFAELNVELHKRDSGNLNATFKTELNTLLVAPMAAVQNGVPQKGSFPLIVYSAGLNNSSQDNVVLCEYLASYGYVVITVPQLGTTSLDINLRFQNPIDIETQALDLQQAIAAVRDFSNLNHNRLGIIGYSVGGVIALNLAMRNNDVDALVTLDPTFGVTPFIKLAANSPYYAATNLRIPWMHMYRVEPATDFAVFDALKYSNRYKLELSGMAHQDFSSFPMFAAQAATSPARKPESARRGHQTICYYILNFFGAYLKGDEKSLALIRPDRRANAVSENIAKFEVRNATAPPPTEEKFLSVLKQNGFARAIELYSASRGKDPSQPVFSEAFLNQVGYTLINQKQITEAVEIFKLNAEAYPASANVYDSLGEAYLLSGNKEMAIKFYEKSIELNPNNKGAIEAVRKLKETP